MEHSELVGILLGNFVDYIECKIELILILEFDFFKKSRLGFGTGNEVFAYIFFVCTACGNKCIPYNFFFFFNTGNNYRKEQAVLTVNGNHAVGR